MLKILWKFIALLGHGYLFFAYALKYNLSLVVVSKLGNIDGAYDSKAKVPFGLESFDLEAIRLRAHGRGALDRLRAERLLPNFETTWQGALFEGHNKKKTPMPFLKLLSRYNNL
ncbi:MAG: hypothetical protein JRI30_08045 [Deltaproteobacteria bacterium]|nr:hypothetical protein [Deltaproteobacteria bacterium]